MSNIDNVSNTNSKVYIEIVDHLRRIIDEDGLTAGDKLPSERELAERLKVGRSSVREALRSLELLGLIETRRGEGTFLKDFRDHQLINLLGTFILQGEKTRNDLIFTKHLLEKSCIDILVLNSQEHGREIFELAAMSENIEENIELIMPKIVEAIGNSLLYRIWTVINEYIKALPDSTTVKYDTNDYENYKNLIHGLFNKDFKRTMTAFSSIVKKNLSNFQ